MNREPQSSRTSIARWIIALCFFVLAGALPLSAATTKITNTTNGKVVVQRSRVARAASAVGNRLGRAAAAVGNIWRVRGDRPINLGPSNPGAGAQVTASGAINNVTSGTAVGRATTGMGVNGAVGPVNATIDVDADQIFNNDLGQSVAAGPVTKTGPAQAIGGGGGGGGVVVVGGSGVVGAFVAPGSAVFAAPVTVGGPAASSSTAVTSPEFVSAGTPATGIAGPGATIGIAGPPSSIGGPNVMGPAVAGTTTGFVGGNSVATAPVIVNGGSTTAPVVLGNSSTTTPTMAVGVAESGSTTAPLTTSSGSARGNVVIPPTSLQSTTSAAVVGGATGSRSRGVRSGRGSAAPVVVGGGGGTISVPSRGITMHVSATPSSTTAPSTVPGNRFVGQRAILASDVVTTTNGTQLFVDTARVNVPASRLGDIAILSPDITVDLSRGIIIVQSASRATNLALINLANDIATGRRTGAEALNAYNAILSGSAGYSQYTQRILFVPQQ